MRNVKCACALVIAASLAAPCLHAQSPAPAATDAQAPATPQPDPAPASQPWTIGAIKFSGLVDGYYSWANNHPGSGFNQYRNFDVKANSFSINMAKLVLEHDPEPIGFRIDLGFGRTYEIFHATEPGGDIMDWVPQAYVSFKAKTGTQIDFGKFYTSAGAEPTETHLNWNYSRSLIYALGPYYHMGLRVSQPLSSSFSVGAQLLNGWNNVEDNNSGKTFGLTTAWTGSKVSWFNTYYVGPENNDTNSGVRNFYDTVVTVSPTEKVSFYGNFDYGTQKNIGMPGSQDWIAVAGAAHFQFTDKFSVSPRLEYYYDKDGWATGTPQKLKEFTATAEYKWMHGLLTRLEYRRDWSNQYVFERGIGGLGKSQSTLLIGVVGYFGE